MPRRRLRSIGEKGPVEQVEVLPAVREPGERVPVIEEVEVFEPEVVADGRAFTDRPTRLDAAPAAASRKTGPDTESPSRMN